MTATTAKAAKTAVTTKPAVTTRASALDRHTSSALEREKSLFISRNADRCGHLLVRYAPPDRKHGLVITASFTLDEVRNWHQIEVVVPLKDLRREAGGPDRSLITAFGELDEGISAARIARLFAPLSVAQRMASGRRD